MARFRIGGGREIGWNKRWGSVFSIPKKTLVDIWSENNDLLAVLVVAAAAPSNGMRNKTRNRGAASISKGKIAVKMFSIQGFMVKGFCLAHEGWLGHQSLTYLQVERPQLKQGICKARDNLVKIILPRMQEQ